MELCFALLHCGIVDMVDNQGSGRGFPRNSLVTLIPKAILYFLPWVHFNTAYYVEIIVIRKVEKLLISSSEKQSGVMESDELLVHNS